MQSIHSINKSMPGHQIHLSAIQSPLFSQPLVVPINVDQTLSPIPTCVGPPNLSKCADKGRDCCASKVWGEPPRCDSGYIPISTGPKNCPSKFKACSKINNGIGCYGCYAQSGSCLLVTNDMQTQELKQKRHKIQQSRHWHVPLLVATIGGIPASIVSVHF